MLNAEATAARAEALEIAVVVLIVAELVLALLTRRWALAWIALAGSAIASGAGLLAVWSRQTVAAGHPGPGVGLFVAWIAVILLTFHWARVVWARTIVQLAAEEERRRIVAQQQSKTLLDSLDKNDAADDAAAPDAADEPDHPED